MEDYKRLKSIPEHTYENCHNLTCRRKCEKDGYNKAIDDFAESLREKRDKQTMKVGCDDLELRKIAERLKEG